MTEQLRPCPHCGGTHISQAPRPYGIGDVITCHNCTGRIWGETSSEVTAAWNRRSPGPATRARLNAARRDLDFFRDHPASESIVLELEAFLAEWPEPVTPSTPEQPAPTSPWHCAICGQPVRIGDDLRPYHLAGPGNHDAELSSEDRKTLADGLRLTD